MSLALLAFQPEKGFSSSWSLSSQHPRDKGILLLFETLDELCLAGLICAASESSWKGTCGCSWLVLFLLAVLMDRGWMFAKLQRPPLWDRRQLFFAWGGKASVEVNETIQARNGHLISPSSLG